MCVCVCVCAYVCVSVGYSFRPRKLTGSIDLISTDLIDIDLMNWLLLIYANMYRIGRRNRDWDCID